MDIFTDTHTHLDNEMFDEDRMEMIDRAIKSGVTRLFIPSIDSSRIENMIAVKKSFPENVHLMIGVHPVYIKKNYIQELKAIKKWMKTGQFIGVGEIGIDLHLNKEYLDEQKNAFKIQIRWAKELNLPINIHCREAFNEVFHILEEEKSETLSGIFHCFTGTLNDAKKLIDLNFKLGIGGISTFKNGKIDTFLPQIALEHIVLETDAPYLSPSPFRGKRNEPGYIIKIAEKMSELYQESLTTIADITTKNSREIFKI